MSIDSLPCIAAPLLRMEADPRYKNGSDAYKEATRTILARQAGKVVNALLKWYGPGVPFGGSMCSKRHSETFVSPERARILDKTFEDMHRALRDWWYMNIEPDDIPGMFVATSVKDPSIEGRFYIDEQNRMWLLDRL